MVLNVTRRQRVIAGLALFVMMTWGVDGASAQDAVSPQEAIEIATDAYIYGYSLITTEITRVQMSNVPKLEGLRGPMNQFTNAKRYPPADYRGVSAPNA